MVNKKRMKYYKFLELLKRSGRTNIFLAGSYLKTHFKELDNKKAKDILIDWIQNYQEILNELVKNNMVSPK